jgi:uncharacterized membrane protein YccC
MLTGCLLPGRRGHLRQLTCSSCALCHYRLHARRRVAASISGLRQPRRISVANLGPLPDRYSIASVGTVGATPSLLRGTIRFEREGLKLQWGVRFALGVGIPLFIGAATGDLIEAVAISGGALMVGLTDSGGPYRDRVRAMLVTCVTVTVCTFVGELAGHNAIVLVALLAVASFGAGMFIALGLSTYFVALMAPLTITVVSSAPADAAHALERAALAFAGGLFAIALVLVLWRAHAHLPERRAIARVYRALAMWVRDPNADDRAPILVAQTAARQALDASVGWTAVPSPSVEAFRVLVDEADRTYLDLVSLRMARQRLERVDPVVSGRAVDVGRGAVAEALVAVADALESGRWEADPDSIRDRLDQLVAALRDELAVDRGAGEIVRAHELEEMLRRGASVRAELRGAVDLATSWQGEGPPPDPVRHTPPRRAELGLRRPGPILRANLTLRSTAFRHAIRLSVTVGVAAAIAEVSGLARGYWLPLTVLFVLRPDFGSTFTRGLQRYVGTALGVVLATLITAALHPGPYALAALITALSFGVSAFLFANYGLFTLSITAFIIFFVAYAGAHDELATAFDRLLDTTIGATITLGIYALWPTWERALLPDTTADLIEADRVYVHVLLGSWFDGGKGRDAVAAARARARLARTNTEASVQRALLEPEIRRAQFGTDRATGILTSMRRFADGALALEAYFEDELPPAPPVARTLADQLDATLAEVAAAAREHRAPSGLPPLRETQQELAALVGPAVPVAEETDRMVNSLAIAAHVLEAPATGVERAGTGRVVGAVAVG